MFCHICYTCVHFIVKLPFWSLGIFALDSYFAQTHKTVFLYIKGKLKTLVVPAHEIIAYAQDTVTILPQNASMRVCNGKEIE